MASKQTILITGCSDHGLGAALALAFHKAGWRVFASARNMAKLKQAETAGIETVQLDVSSEESIANAVSAVKKLTGGSLDALVNNAGAAFNMPLMDIEIEKARALFELNTFSLLTTTRAFLPLLMESTGGAMVVNNTSILSVSAVPFSGVYAASKAAATSLTEVLRLELAPFGIRVVNLMTGSVKSSIWDNAPAITLPPASLYNIAKEAIEKFMGGANVANGTDPNTWAEGVVHDLGRRNPPHWIWRGQFASQARMISWLPIGFLDKMVKGISGVAVLEQKIKEQGGIRKINLHH
ncbi:putative estradiol 17 beta-dehydrogenase [Hypoxylon rubiginosum]|uniref:Estradiol 17 beta-dehydrogenase n=1 Tax=Hypoxylon rubiginosum TaxID=110542 RepID=A0ACB9YIM7_9PEZI|nr:putative estradiol 17 beta-dehydrogenase [Hypoxylon rubiginosum]